MRVLYCTDTFPPQVNGVSVVTALSVAGMRARGWDVHVLAPRYPAPSAHIAGGEDAPVGTWWAQRAGVTAVPSVPLPFYREVRVALASAAAARRTVAAFKPDLVHCQTEFLIGRAGRVAAMRAGIPVVTSYHTNFSKYAEAYRMPWLEGPVARHLARFHRSASRTFTPSEASRDDLRGRGVPDVETRGRGVDAARFHPSRRSASLRAKLGVDDAFTFLYVGRLANEKSVDVVLAAFRRVRTALGVAARLVVAGEGPAEPVLRASAPGGTVFLGQLNDANDLPELYASADAFVFASTTETLGLVVLEAMASGLPVVASACGGVGDHLRDGENGLAFPARDEEACASAMLRLAYDRALLNRLRFGARRTAESLGWEKELDRLDASYREIIDGHVSRRSPRS
jgi:glycosyltransferase involved in cell wall biosynthesis